MDCTESLFIIDGYGQIYRSYYAFVNNPLRDRNSNNISAVYGFFSTLISLIKQHKPQYIAVALDSKAKTFRNELFPEYKANRAKAPEDLHAQVPLIKVILSKMKIKYFEIPTMEADDIIASLCCKAEKKGIKSVMVTGDKDLLQLVNDNTVALRPPRKGETDWSFCDTEAVKTLFGVYPKQIVDYLTILGDSSDNVPGINGIGEKGAVALLSEWETLDAVYENLDSVKPALKTKLENAKEGIGLSRTLIELKKDILDFNDEDFSTLQTSLIDWHSALEEFTLLGSNRLVNSVSKFTGFAVKKSTVENSGRMPEHASDRMSSRIPSRIPDGMPDMLCVYDLKNSPKALEVLSTGRKVFDILLAEWLLNSSVEKYEIEDLSLKYFKQTFTSNQEAIDKLAPIIYSKLIERNLEKVYFDLEMPLAQVLHNMESRGIILDTQALSAYGEEINRAIGEIERTIYSFCGHEFNINSTKQLGEVLFTERQLPSVKKNQTGYSTDSDVLEILAQTTEDPVVPLLIRYRALSKLQNTYIVPLAKQVDGQSRIHTTFLQTGTATGRLSSKNPNLQNIPIRTEEGRQIRYAFVAQSGFVLLSADYAQIELAVLAHLSQDEQLCNAFKNAQDVHKETAALIFQTFGDFVTPEQRRIAKTINFGVIYGMSAFRLARDLKIKMKDAQAFIDTYFEKYKGVSSFIEETVSKARKDGFVTTLSGHQRRIDDLYSENKNVRSAAERIAVNSVIQGSAADIMKLAMLSVERHLKEAKLQSRILLQVHDELILEVKEEELSQVKKTVENCMVNAVNLSVPLRVSIESAKRWGEMH